MPVLAIRQAEDAYLLRRLRNASDFGLWEVENVTPEIASLSARLGGVIVATSGDPAEAVARAVLAGVVSPLMVVTERKQGQESDVCFDDIRCIADTDPPEAVRHVLQPR